MGSTETGCNRPLRTDDFETDGIADLETDTIADLADEPLLWTTRTPSESFERLSLPVADLDGGPVSCR